MSEEDRYGGYTPRRATKFYVPLLLQAFSQSLTYPLVASIVTHGEWGVNTLTAFAQGQCVMFMIGAFGGGLVMTGMVFARTLRGYRSFIRMNAAMMTALLLVQVLAGIHPFDDWIFSRMLNLPPDLAVVARNTMLWGLVMQAGFFLRNVPLVVLFNNRASFEANLATAARILLTAAAPLLFLRMGWTGAGWGMVAMTIPCMLELLVTWLFARPYVRKLERDDSGTDDAALSSVPRQFRFTMPLSVGGFLLAMSPFMVAAFVGRTEDAVAMLAIHYVTIGLANPVGYAAWRMQPVAIQFPPEYAGDSGVVKYAVCAGAVLGLIPLLCALPGISDWYFHVVQNVPGEHVGLCRIVMCGYALWPVLQCVRGYAEGYSAWRKRPTAVLFSQFAYLAALTAALALMTVIGLPGWTMGIVAIFVATMSAISTLAGYHRIKK